MGELFLECIVAPDFSADATAILKQKKNLRLVSMNLQSYQAGVSQHWQLRTLSGCVLLQSADLQQCVAGQWTHAAGQPSAEQSKDLEFAMRVSNILNPMRSFLLKTGKPSALAQAK